MATTQPADFSKLSITHPDMGEMILEGFEVPESITFGGEQRVIVNQYIGTNKRQLQILGAQPEPLGWTGQFMFENGLARARFLDRMRELGKEVKFVWGDFRFDAVIEKFQYSAKHKNRIEYTIALQIVKLEESAGRNFTLPPSGFEPAAIMKLFEFILDVISVLRKIQAFVTAVQKGGINGMVTATLSLLGIFGTVSGQVGLLTAEQLAKAAQDLELLIRSTRTLIDTIVDSDFSGLPIADLIAAEGSAKVLQQAIQKYSVANSSNATTIIRGNAFELAQKYYGTMDAWEVIVRENKLSGPQISGPVKIKLPPFKGVQPKFFGDQTVYETRRSQVPSSS